MSKDIIANREYVESNMELHGMNLAESVVDFMNTHEIPLEKIRQYFDQALIDTLKAELAPLRKNHKKRKRMFLGFIKS